MGNLLEKYLDDKAILVVQGGVAETTELLKQKFDKIIYTGNGDVGRVIMRAAAEHLTPVILELGGKSPLVIGPDVNMERAVPRITWGKFINCGQTCIAPDYVMVHESRYDEFLASMKKQIQKFYGDNPQESPDYGKIINPRHAARIEALMRSSGEVYCGGKVDQEAAYVEPTLIVNADVESELMRKEIFGPLLPVMKYSNVDSVIQFINDRPKPLALYVFAQDKGFIDKVLTNTSSGGGCVNETVMHNICKELPFGGVGDSGMGAYNGKISFDSFSHHKGMLVRSQSKDVDLRFPPYTPSKLAWLNRIDAFTQKLKLLPKRAIMAVVVATLAYFLYRFYA
jgi:acyl-CoA reductase-like NAD-dependent aldehyde dehydrogenase